MSETMVENRLIYQIEPDKINEFVTNIIEDKIVLEGRDEVTQTILVMVLNEIDFDLADKLCHKYLNSSDYYVKQMALMAAGHIARVYGKLINEDFYKEIVAIYCDKSSPYWENAEGALADIRMFLKIPMPA